MDAQNARASFDRFTTRVARMKDTHVLPAYVVVRAAQHIYDADAKRFPGRERIRKHIENEVCRGHGANKTKTVHPSRRAYARCDTSRSDSPRRVSFAHTQNLHHVVLQALSWDHIFDALVDVGCVRTIDSNGTFVVDGSMGDLSAAVRERCVLSSDDAVVDFVLRHGLSEAKCATPLATMNKFGKRAKPEAPNGDDDERRAQPPEDIPADVDASRATEDAIAHLRATLATHVVNIERECAEIIAHALKAARKR
jgi:hypothetical protein